MTTSLDAPIAGGAGRTTARLRTAALWVGGIAVGWVLLAALLPSGAPVGVVASGAILGSATGLTAVGLILIWRANRVINFANGAMAGVAGLTAVHLFVSWGWPYPVTLVVGPLLGLLVGAIVEVTVIRRFSESPRLVLTVATIGLAQLLGGIELLIPSKVFGASGMVLGAFDTPLNSVEIELGPTVINGNHLLTLAVVPVVVGALAWFLRRSLAGTAIRAASENTDRARLLGVPVRNLTTIVWAIAGGLAALTFVLQAPFQGAAPSATAGPAVLLAALAAAIVARMESLPIAFVAAVGLGVMQELVRWNTNTPSLVDVAILVVILVALLVGERGRSRAHDADGGWRNADLVRDLAPAIAALPAVRWAKRIGLALLVAAAVVVPMLLGPSDAFSVSIMAVWAMVAVSLVVLTGWAGQISLGQFAIVGAGAIVAGNMVSRWNIDLFIVLAVATATGALVAVLLGVPALRIKGPFLAVVTLSFAVVLDSYVLNPNVFPALIPQTVDRPLLWGRVDLGDERSMLWFTLAMLAVCVALARGVRRSRSGRLLIAARDNRKAAEAASVSTRWTTLQGFIFSGAIAGLAGGIHVLLLNGAREGSYQVVQSVEVFSGATIGGLGSLGGAIVGAAGLRGAQDLDATIRLVGAGVGVLIVLWIVPAGLAGLAARVRDRLVRPIAARAGLDLSGAALQDPAELPPAPTTLQDRLPVDEPTVVAQDAAVGAPPVFAGAAPEQGWTPPTPLLRAGDVDVSYGQLQVLFGVDLDVHEGEVVALLGTNGAGKSTILRAICGLSRSSGSITLDGDRIGGRSPEQIVRDGIALMPGGKAVFPTLSVADHLRLACWTFRTDRPRIASSLAEVHRLFPILEERRHQLAGDLSGGEQQQLALATTLLLRPRVLLIDELSLGLSPLVVAALCDVVRRLNADGMTIVVVEQSVNVALSIAERAVFMEKGTVRFEGPTRDLLDRPDLLRSVFIEGADAGGGGAAGSGAAGSGAADDEDDADRVMAAIDLTKMTAATSDDRGAGGPVLRCDDVTKRFGGVQALSHVDLVVRPGEIVGLIGQNGAGKTTLMDCISGFHSLSRSGDGDRPGDEGAIVFRGRDVTDWSPFERARSGMGRTFQEARLFPSLTVSETLAVACERGVGNRSLVADATRLPASYLAEDRTIARVRELTGLLGLDRYAHTPTSALSTGTRRIVELGCLLAEEPVLMLLDEPSAGVAQRETEALGPLLRRIRDHTGAAMLVIEHDMPLLSGLCDRLVAMELGSVIAEGTPEDVLAHEDVIASYLGTDTAAINRSGAALS